MLNALKRARHRAAIRAAYFLRRRDKERVLFILSQPRTGSTLLVDYLNSIPGVSMAGEILSPELPQGIRPRRAPRRAALAHIRDSLNALPEPRCGAKFLLDQLALHRLTVGDLDEHWPDAAYVLLYRGSLLEQFVSFRVARLTGKWIGGQATARFEGTLPIDPGQFARFCAQERAKYAAILAMPWLRTRCRLVRYEDLAARPQEVVSREACPLLGLETATVSTRMVKQNHRPLDQVITNYAEVEPLAATCGRLELAVTSDRQGPPDES